MSGQDSQLTFASGEIAEVAGARIVFEGTVGPADFFKGLHRVETAFGSRYMKASEEVKFSSWLVMVDTRWLGRMPLWRQIK